MRFRFMNKYTWQRLKNLSLFKLWVTDKELSQLWPIAVLIALVLFLIVGLRFLFFS